MMSYPTAHLLPSLLPLAAYTRPFLQPLPVWDYWYLLLLPLLLAIGLVYKATKCTHVREVPVEALKMVFWIVAAFSAGAVGLLIFVRLTQ